VVIRDARAGIAPGQAVVLGPPGQTAFPAPLRLVHEDDDLLVIVKPAGLLTIATERERERTAYRLLWDHLARRSPPRRPFIVHRLDRETSGLLVFARTPAAKRSLQSQFQARTVERVYVARVEGVVREGAGELRSRLVEDRSLRIRAARGGSRGVEAITRFRVLERYRDATLLEVTLVTGRRGQIRVQLAARGHPVVGDRTHGSQRDPLGRLGLHATRLGFVHPQGRRVVFDSPAPVGFRRA
jgi:23S rRNA pseudouridine1911/1915/1917 synthase